MNKVRRILLIIVLVANAVFLSGCVLLEGANALSNAGTGYFERKERQRSLEKVARDWCLTIRASQVIPIYPLMEDFEVGDSFIVSTPTSELKSYWNKRGYLPIETTLSRMHPKGYAEFYREGYGLRAGSDVPRLWQFPHDSQLPHKGIPVLPAQKMTVKESEDYLALRDKIRDAAFRTNNWSQAPRVGFPSYTFDIRRGESFKGAIPVKSVPVMLGALGGRKFSGSVSLSNAFSYGIDDISLTESVRSWAWSEEMRSILAPYATSPDEFEAGKAPNYLRVVSRVFLVKSVTVSLTDSTAKGFKLSVGSPKDDAGSLTCFQKVRRA
ncbi:MAG: hypothetical protein MI807_11235 [Verrucomicrobiales bacterium]|nr:hypothetical protein [Verrucomicrobiales bacterium]